MSGEEGKHESLYVRSVVVLIRHDHDAGVWKLLGGRRVVHLSRNETQYGHERRYLLVPSASDSFMSYAFRSFPRRGYTPLYFRPMIENPDTTMAFAESPSVM